MAQVFISYSSKETDQANEIVKALEAQGIRCWIAPRDIPVGSDYTDEIPEGIDACPFFLVLLSPNSQASQWVKMELTQAVGDRKCVLPLLLEDFSVSRGFTFLLRNAQIRPYFQDKDATVQELVSRISGQMPQAAPTPKPTELSAEECYQTGENYLVAGDYKNAAQYLQRAVVLKNPNEHYIETASQNKDTPCGKHSLLQTIIDAISHYQNTKQREPYVLRPGTYLVGTNVPSGSFDLLAQHGSGNFRIYNQKSSSWILGNPIGITDELTPSRYRNITLLRGDKLEINGNVIVMLSPSIPIVPSSSELLGPGIYRFGWDIPSGKYDLIATSGEGDAIIVNIKHNKFLLFQSMTNGNGKKASELRNLVFTKNNDLWINGNLQMRLIPAQDYNL